MVSVWLVYDLISLVVVFDLCAVFFSVGFCWWFFGAVFSVCVSWVFIVFWLHVFL